MRKIVRSQRIADVDRLAQEQANIPELLLMESAGLQAYLALRPRLQKQDRLLFLVGGGNNGGDALVVSRYAYNDGFTDQRILYTSTSFSEACATQRSIIKEYQIPTISEAEALPAVAEAEWIIDGISGTGLKGPLKESLMPLVESINRSKSNVFAIDIPSGLGDMVPVLAPAIKADLTVTMGYEKVAMYHPTTRVACGEIIVVNPTFPPPLLEAVESVAMLIEESAVIPALRSDEYKNTRAHLAIIGGSKRYPGAPRLSARAAFASRAGLVSLLCDEEIFSIVAMEAPSVMVRPYTEDEKDSYDAVLIGPGWGEQRVELLADILRWSKPTVIDADGIRAFAELVKRDGAAKHGSLILTPHLGEFRTLKQAVDPDDGEETPLAFLKSATRIAAALSATLVIKSSLVHIVDPQGEVHIIEGNNPSLGVAGSGDVLSGIIAALLAKYDDPAMAALQGSLIHQEAGRAAYTVHGYYDSEQLLHYVGTTVKEAQL